MISNHSHFQPRCQIIKKAETGTPHRKYILQKALLSVAGPEIQIIHIKALDLDSPVDPHSQPEKQPHKDQMILPFIFFSILENPILNFILSFASNASASFIQVCLPDAYRNPFSLIQ